MPCQGSSRLISHTDPTMQKSDIANAMFMISRCHLNAASILGIAGRRGR